LLAMRGSIRACECRDAANLVAPALYIQTLQSPNLPMPKCPSYGAYRKGVTTQYGHGNQVGRIHCWNRKVDQAGGNVSLHDIVSKKEECRKWSNTHEQEKGKSIFIDGIQKCWGL
jgi:hypothetical protein